MLKGIRLVQVEQPLPSHFHALCPRLHHLSGGDVHHPRPTAPEKKTFHQVRRFALHYAWHPATMHRSAPTASIALDLCGMVKFCH